MRKQTLLIIAVIFLYTAIVLFLWNRLHYGVDVSDEAFYVGESYIIAHGSLPLTENWQKTSLSSMMSAPLVKLYTVMTGSSEGIYLFMRQGFLLFKLLVTGVLAVLFRQKFPLTVSLLLSLPYLALSLFSIDNFSYNTLSFAFLLISTLLLYCAIEASPRQGKPFSCMGGIVMALAVLAHPLLVCTAVCVSFLSLIFEWKRHHTLVRSALFASSGMSAGLLVLTLLAVLSGGPEPVINGIRHMMASPYWHITGVGWPYNLNVLLGHLLLLGNLLVILIPVLTTLFLVFRYVLKQDNLPRLSVTTLFVTQFLCIAFLICRYPASPDLIRNLSITYVFLMALLLLAAGRRSYSTLIGLVGLPFLFTYLLYIPFNYSGIAPRGYLLFPSIILALALTYAAIARHSAFPTTCVILLCSLLCLACLKGYNSYVYRDAPLPDLTYKMEKGVYKGLYTTKKRGNALIYLEEEIKKITDRQDHVLIMDQLPSAYMMTEARHCTPSTWDPWFYAYSYRNLLEETYDAADDTLMQDYFKASGHEPSKIIYILDRERLEEISLRDKKFRFNQYVEHHYTQTYANTAELFPLILFERIQD